MRIALNKSLLNSLTSAVCRQLTQSSPRSRRGKSEGVTDVTPSIETVARCDSASSLTLAGICHWAFPQISR